MRKVTASQKVATLEKRVAQLEKQALIQMIKNMGKNVLRPLTQIAGDISSSVQAVSAKSDRKFYVAVEGNLEARLNRSLERNFIFGKGDSVQILSFDPKNPMNSEIEVTFHLNGEKNVEKTKIKAVSRVVKMTDELKKDIMGTYVSWWKDWESVLQVVRTGKADKTTIQRVIQGVKSVSKFLYRVLTAFSKLSAVISIFNVFINGFVVNVFTQGIGYFVAAPLALPIIEFVMLLEGKGLGPMGATVVAKLADKFKIMIEGAFRRRKVNIDKFNELASKSASVNKYARKYPETYSFLLRLENAGI